MNKLHFSQDLPDSPRSLLKKSLVVAAIASSIVLAPAAQAIEAKLSGQVSRMLVLPDDAVGDEWQHQDIGWSGSRFRFTGTEEMSNGITAGFRFEIQARNNNPGTNGAQLGNNGDNQDNRYQDLYFSGGFGKISFGKGDGASNGSTEVDMSGTALASAGPLQDNWGGYEIVAGQAWNTVYTMDDGLSRQNRVRYDTPKLGSFSVAVSLNQGNASEIALRYKGDVAGGKLGFAVFTATGPDASATVSGDEIVGGSASLLLGSGLNFTVALSDRDFEATGLSRDAFMFKVGYKVGMHAVTIDIAESENAAVIAQEGESFGVTYAYFPHKGVELFGMVRTLDSTGVAGASSVDLLAIGSRIKF